MHLVLNMFIFTRTLVTYATTMFKPRCCLAQLSKDPHLLNNGLLRATSAVSNDVQKNDIGDVDAHHVYRTQYEVNHVEACQYRFLVFGKVR
jgi:hypothetical protein